MEYRSSTWLQKRLQGHSSYATHFFIEVYRQNLTGGVWILSDVFIFDSIPGFSPIFDGSIVVKPRRFSSETEFEERKKAFIAGLWKK